MFPLFFTQAQRRTVSTELEIFSYQTERLRAESSGKPAVQHEACHMWKETWHSQEYVLPRCRGWLLPKGGADNLAFVHAGLFIVLMWLTAFLWDEKAWMVGDELGFESQKKLSSRFVPCDSKRALFPLKRRLSTFICLNWEELDMDIS